MYPACCPKVKVLAPRAAGAMCGPQLLHAHVSSPSIATMKDMRKERPNKTVWCGHLFYSVICFLAFFVLLEIPNTLKMMHCKPMPWYSRGGKQEEQVVL